MQSSVHRPVSRDRRFSMADTFENCVKCDKGVKIATNEAYETKFKIRVGGISKISAFVRTPMRLLQTKAFR